MEDTSCTQLFEDNGLGAGPTMSMGQDGGGMATTGSADWYSTLFGGSTASAPDTSTSSVDWTREGGNPNAPRIQQPGQTANATQTGVNWLNALTGGFKDVYTTVKPQNPKQPQMPKMPQVQSGGGTPSWLIPVAVLGVLAVGVFAVSRSGNK